MLKNELDTQLQRKSELRKKINEQCDTFQHLGPQDSLSYNWVRHSTECQAHVPAHELAPNFHSVKASVLELLAESPTTSPRTLEVLAFNRSRRVRQAVADNPRTPLTALRTLAYDDSPEVRFALAENHNIPDDILNILAEDENPYVRVRAQETLEVITEGEFIDWIHRFGFKRGNRPEAPIDRATQESIETACACAINCKCANPGANQTDTCSTDAGKGDHSDDANSCKPNTSQDSDTLSSIDWDQVD